MTNLPKKIYFVMNPEGKIFQDSVREQKHLCKMAFVNSWFGSWNITASLTEADTVFGMMERKGFKIIEAMKHDSEEAKEMIRKYYRQGVSLAGITSLLYVHGVEGIAYIHLRKYVFKELQRIDSKLKLTAAE